jgi:hypothetical protein
MERACGIGYHVIHDKMTPGQRAILLAHLANIQPATVNITGAERYPESLNFVQAVLDACPRTIVFERRIGRPGGGEGQDEGIWQLPEDVWFNWRVMPYLNVLGHPRVVVVYDNESSMGDFTPYAEKMVAAAALADAVNVALGLGRVATGNPGEGQYGQLGPMWKALKGSRHWWTPNEYAGPTPQASAGHLARYALGWAAAKFQPLTSIGEFGTLVWWGGAGLDPHKGYQDLGWHEDQYADHVIENFRAWYQPKKVPVMVYAPENQDKVWRRLGVGGAFYRRIEARLEETLIEWPPKGVKLEEEEIPKYTLTRAQLVNMGRDKNLRVREGPGLAFGVVGTIQTGHDILYAAPVLGERLDTRGEMWVPVILADGRRGYAFGYYLDLPDEAQAQHAVPLHVGGGDPIEIEEPPVQHDDTQETIPVVDEEAPSPLTPLPQGEGEQAEELVWVEEDEDED